jgi:hypothetical protein
MWSWSPEAWLISRGPVQSSLATERPYPASEGTKVLRLRSTANAINGQRVSFSIALGRHRD